MRHRVSVGIGLLGCLAAAWAVASAPQGGSPDVASTRDLTAINWMEFKDVVPNKVDTVLLPTGTLEPHGVINNGADITAPVAMARTIAREVNAMIAPVIPYGITGSMDAFPGAFSISEAAYRAYVRDVMLGLVRCGFNTIVVLNGHGGPQTAVLNEIAREVGQEKKVRTLVINWWSFASDVTLASSARTAVTPGGTRRRTSRPSTGRSSTRSATPTTSPRQTRPRAHIPPIPHRRRSASTSPGRGT
jgi:hypothetical protein